MSPKRLSLRGKMVLPAGLGAVATIVATAVTLALSSAAASQLSRAQAVDVPTMVFWQQMEQRLVQLDLLLRWVGDTELDSGGGDGAYASRIDEPENVFLDMDDAFAKDGERFLGAAQTKELRAAVEAFWEAGKTNAARRVSDRLKFKKEREGRADAMRANGQSAEERAAAARNQEIENQFTALHKRFSAGVQAAKAKTDAALVGAVAGQRRSIIVGATILLGVAVGAMILAWWFSGRASRPVHRLSQIALRIADGDLTQDVAVEADDEIGLLAQSFQRMVGRLRALVSTLKSVSEDLAGAAEQLSAHTRSQTAMLERQATGIAETTVTTRQLEQSSSIAATRAAAVLEVARRATDMSSSGREAAERSAGELRRIQGSVEEIVTQSGHLLEQARQVGDIVESVQDLAVQSHVLSLNASIEASKAGEAGRSFAVVAQEVRALADQSGQSAGRIADMVGSILTAIQSTRELTERGGKGVSGSLGEIRASGESLREIGDIVRETGDAALHIASAVQQQSTGIAQIATAMRDLDSGMEETMGRIRALERSAQQVAEDATRISGIAAEFRV